MFLSVATLSYVLLLQAKTTPPRATPTPSSKAVSKGATPKPAVVPLPPSPFGDGEKAVYNVSWSAMSAGTATLSINASRGASGVDSWTARAEATPSSMLSNLYTLRYTAESVFDARTLLPRRSLVDGTEGKRRRVRRTVFNHAQRKAEYSVTIGDTVSRTIDIAPDSLDILSIVYKVRTLPLAAGFQRTLPVSDNGHRYSFTISVGQQTSVTTPLGPLLAWKVTSRVVGEDGKVEAGEKIMWLSADDRRLLLRAETTLSIGKVTLELASLTPGKL